MGLDQYLTRKLSLPHFDTLKDASTEYGQMYKQAQAVITAVGRDPSRHKGGIIEVSLPEAYWRKANQIHGWFVRNVQDGVDECQESYVDREQLQELLDLCKRLLDLHDSMEPSKQALADKAAQEELPGQTGFFFGNDEIDSWYWGTVRQTADVLELALASPGGDFYYQASW